MLLWLKDKREPQAHSRNIVRIYLPGSLYCIPTLFRDSHFTAFLCNGDGDLVSGLIIVMLGF